MVGGWGRVGGRGGEGVSGSKSMSTVRQALVIPWERSTADHPEYGMSSAGPKCQWLK